MQKQSLSSRQWSVYCIIVAALFWTAYLNLNAPYSHAVLAIGSNDPANPLGFDAYIQKTAADGNAIILFRGFSPRRDKDRVFIERIYFRSNYAAFPRRIFVCDDNEPFDAKRVAEHLFAPSDSWMKDHDIRCILTFAGVPGKNMQWTERRI